MTYSRIEPMLIYNKLQSRTRGFTMIELMIAMVLGLLLIGIIMTMLGSARESFRKDGAFASMQNEARFAIHELSHDLRMSGYITNVLMPDNVNLDASAAIGVDCENMAGTPWALTLQDPVTGDDTFLMALDNTTGVAAAAQFGCLTASQIVAGTDIVAIKRVAGTNTTAALTTGDMAIGTNGTSATLFVQPITTPVGGVVENWIYTPSIYFVRDFTTTVGDNIPSLCRMFLESGTPPNMRTECIAEGVEDLQLEYGVDIDEDGSVNIYVTDPTQAQLEQTISVRFFVLSRTTELDLSVNDTKTYSLSNAADYTPNDNFHRRVFSSTVTIPNAHNRILLGL